MKKIKLVRMVDDYINDKNYSMIYKNNNLDIINYTKILDFSDTKITITFKQNKYTIEGINLVIAKMMEEELLITGKIYNISFETKG